MARQYVPESRVTGTRSGRRVEGVGVDRVDVGTLRSAQAEPADRRASSYFTDGRGQVRLMVAPQSREGDLSPWTNYYYRLAGSREWRDFGRYNSITREGVRPLAIDAECNCAYALKTLNGRLALYRIGLDESLGAELIYANQRVDVDDIVRIGRSGKVAGVTYAEDRREVIWFDQQYAEIARTVTRALPGQPAIYFAGASGNGSKLVVLAQSDSNPGRYYLYDRSRRTMEELMPVRPQLDGVTLSSVRPISYPGPDGTRVPT